MPKKKVGTARQRMAAKKFVGQILENTGTKRSRASVSGAMRAVGYAPGSAKNPKQLTESKAWPLLLEEMMPDSYLAEKHLELNNAAELTQWDFPKKLKDSEIRNVIADISGARLIRTIVVGRYKTAYFTIPQNMVRKFAIEMAYKLKGRFAPEQYVHKFQGMKKEQLVDYIIRKVTQKK